MAESLLRALLAERGIEGVEVSSAGLLPGGMPATAHARFTVAGLEDHSSRQLTPELLADADLVLAMAREHIREAALLCDCLTRTYTLKEIVRRGAARGPRRAGESVGEWLARIGAGRKPSDLVGDSPDDDVADPIGSSLATYRATAAELERLLGSLADLLWPDHPAPGLSGT
jgi:protein-tyrosine phosphatase